MAITRMDDRGQEEAALVQMDLPVDLWLSSDGLWFLAKKRINICDLTLTSRHKLNNMDDAVDYSEVSLNLVSVTLNSPFKSGPTQKSLYQSKRS